MPDAKVPALMAPSAVEEGSKLGTDLGNAAAAGPAVEPISAMRRLKQDALLFSILSIVFGVVFLGAYFSIYRTGNGGDKFDEDDDSVPLDKFTNPMFHRFFDEACLLAMDPDDDDKGHPLRIVDNYLRLWIESEAVASVVLSCVQLVIVFGAQQTDGVPNPNTKLGFVLWMLWVVGITHVSHSPSCRSSRPSCRTRRWPNARTTAVAAPSHPYLLVPAHRLCFGWDGRRSQTTD